jgi:hypothetical protein
LSAREKEYELIVVAGGATNVHATQLPDATSNPVPPNCNEAVLLTEHEVALPLSRATTGSLAALVHPSMPVTIPEGVVHE